MTGQERKSVPSTILITIRPNAAMEVTATEPVRVFVEDYNTTYLPPMQYEVPVGTLAPNEANRIERDLSDDGN
jgi:hypothetical protein